MPTADYGAGLIDKCNGMAFSELLDQRLMALVSLDGVLEYLLQFLWIIAP